MQRERRKNSPVGTRRGKLCSKKYANGHRKRELHIIYVYIYIYINIKEKKKKNAKEKKKVVLHIKQG